MSATPNTFAIFPQPSLPGPQLTKAAAATAADGDFRQVFAAAKTADAKIAGNTVPIAMPALPSTPMIPIETKAENLKSLLTSKETLQSSTAKRGKKIAGTKQASARPAGAQPQQSLVQSTAVDATALARNGVPAIVARAVTQPEASDAAALPALTPAAPVAANNIKPDAAIIMVSAKEHKPDAVAKPVDTPLILQNTPQTAISIATVKPALILSVPPKTTAILKQIAAAIPKSSASNAGAPTALHISLTPETLGTITVKIAQHMSGETAVTITASQPETLSALKHDAPNLNQILTNAGVPDANRQIVFQNMPLAPAQTGTALNNNAQPQAGHMAGQFTGGHLGQGNGNGQQQTGTGFASSLPGSVLKAVAPATPILTRQAPNRNSSVDVIA